MMNTEDIEVSLEQLVLDPNNYRLADGTEESRISDDDAIAFESETIKSIDNQRLGELKDSIRTNGFLEMERIVVRLLNTEENKTEEDLKKKKYIVVEGNRRTAALKSLKKEQGIPDALIEKLKKLNVLLIDGEPEQIDKYAATLMGVRHVSGPKKWDGFQSAKLIHDLYEKGDSFSEIGDVLGMTNREVGRRFRGYKAFQQMRAEPKFKEKLEARHYALLLEFLSPSKQGRSWLKWNDSLFRFEHKNNLERVYTAITPNDDGYLEVRNPGDARKFVYLLETEYKGDIEKGLTTRNMPDPDDLKDSGKAQRIKKFISFIEKSNFNDDELNSLSDLYVALQSKIGE